MLVTIKKCLIFSLVIWLLFETIFTVRDFRKDMKNTSKSVKSIAQGINEIVGHEKELLQSDKVNNIRENTARFVAGLPIIIGKMDKSVELLNTSTIPKLNKVLDNTNTITISINNLIIKSNGNLDQLSYTTTALLNKYSDVGDSFVELVKNEKIQEILIGFVNLEKQVNTNFKELELTNKEINQNLPVLLKELIAIENNVNSGTKSLSDIIGKLNEKPTKLQRVYRALITLGLISAKVLLQ